MTISNNNIEKMTRSIDRDDNGFVWNAKRLKKTYSHTHIQRLYYSHQISVRVQFLRLEVWMACQKMIIKLTAINPAIRRNGRNYLRRWQWRHRQTNEHKSQTFLFRHNVWTILTLDSPFYPLQFAISNTETQSIG